MKLIGQLRELTDEDLMREVIIQRNQSAFHELVRRYRGLVVYPQRIGMGEAPI